MAMALMCLPSPVLAQFQLTPVATGLSNPIFAGHAGDGTQRLFIVEQDGIVRVLRSGQSTATISD